MIFGWDNKRAPEAVGAQVLEGGKLPTKAHSTDAGWDIYAPETIYIEPRQLVSVDAAIAVAVPDGCVGLILGRSSMNKRGVLCQTGVVDAGYTGELGVILVNLSERMVCIRQGERLAQLVIAPINTSPIQQVARLPATQRANKGFGSSGA